LLNKEESAYKAILRGSELIAIVRQGYRLLPNEEVLTIVRNLAPEIGATCFQEYIYGNRIFLTYLMEEKLVESGDAVKLGFSVRNSIDGTMGFGVDGFTWRKICDNGALIKGRDIANVYRKHTKSLIVAKEELTATIWNVIDAVRNFFQRYQAWRSMQLNQEIAEKLSRLPQKYWPKVMTMQEDQLILTAEPDLWQVYNDCTAAIWHSPTLMHSKQIYFNQLHEAFPTAE
jgi:hypothetical protein